MTALTRLRTMTRMAICKLDCSLQCSGTTSLRQYWTVRPNGTHLEELLRMLPRLVSQGVLRGSSNWLQIQWYWSLDSSMVCRESVENGSVVGAGVGL
jgi:hypothetical protein